MRNRLSDYSSQADRLDDLSAIVPGAAAPMAQCQHILVPVGATHVDRPSAMMALRLGSLLWARVTFLQVDSPPVQSLSWLDAIDQLHETLPSRSRCSMQKAPDGSVRTRRMRMIEWIEREIPTSLRNDVEIGVEARFGDLASEVRRYVARNAVDLLVLHRVTSRWRKPVLPRPARRIMRTTHTPAIVVHPDFEHSVSLALGDS